MSEDKEILELLKKRPPLNFFIEIIYDGRYVNLKYAPAHRRWKIIKDLLWDKRWITAIRFSEEWKIYSRQDLTEKDVNKIIKSLKIMKKREDDLLHPNKKCCDLIKEMKEEANECR